MLAEKKAKLEAEKKAKLLAEKKAKLEAEKKAKMLAEKKAKLEAEKKAKMLAEKKAKLEAEKKAKLVAKKRKEEIEKNLNWFQMSSAGFKRILVSDNYIFNFSNSANNDLRVLHSKINEYFKLSDIEISNDEIIELKNFIKDYK